MFSSEGRQIDYWKTELRTGRMEVPLLMNIFWLLISSLIHFCMKIPINIIAFSELWNYSSCHVAQLSCCCYWIIMLPCWRDRVSRCEAKGSLVSHHHHHHLQWETEPDMWKRSISAFSYQNLGAILICLKVLTGPYNRLKGVNWAILWPLQFHPFHPFFNDLWRR